MIGLNVGWNGLSTKWWEVHRIVFVWMQKEVYSSLFAVVDFTVIQCNVINPLIITFHFSDTILHDLLCFETSRCDVCHIEWPWYIWSQRLAPSINEKSSSEKGWNYIQWFWSVFDKHSSAPIAQDPRCMTWSLIAWLCWFHQAWTSNVIINGLVSWTLFSVVIAGTNK
jgi:hypothetical protein